MGAKWINHPDQVGVCTNKKHFFNAIKTARVPEWTTDYDTALGWFENGIEVVGRHKLTGHSAEGLVIYDHNSEGLEEAKLYTKYVKKESEWRIHIFDGKIIYEQRKAKRNDAEQVDWRVRNNANGFCYVKAGDDALDDINGTVPEDVRTQAMCAMEDVGLNFGAVDVIWNAHQEKAYVLEINTATGLEGTTLERYTQAVKDYCLDNGIEM